MRKSKNKKIMLPRGMKEDDIIQLAKVILRSKVEKSSVIKNFPVCKDYIMMEFSSCHREILGIMYLDLDYRVISFEKMDFSNLVQIETCLRKVARSAIFHDAESIIVTHNFKYQDGLGFFRSLCADLHVVGVRVLDYIVMSNGDTRSVLGDSLADFE